MKKLRINMLSQATSVSGQGVGSAYIEQVALVKSNEDLFEVSENARGHNFDIVHVHTVNPSYRLKMNKKHINVIYVHFIPSTLDGSIKLPKLLFKIFKKYVIGTYRKADEIVVVNPTFIPPLVELGMKEENITYIPNFVSKDQFHPLDNIDELKDKYGIPKDKPIILGCGQIQTRKGVLDYIEVAKKMKDEAYFVWAGGFSFGKITDGYEELKKIVDNPPENVKFLGIVERSQMNEIFNVSDFLFMPSFSELFPMSILEAVNSNKPVVLRDIDLYHDILFDKYERGQNVDDWVEIFRKLISDKDYLKHAQENSKFISDFYSKEHVNELWRKYYVRIYEKYKDSDKKKLSKE